MNFLQLVQRTCLECSSTISSPTTVTGQTGMKARFVNWVAEAWKNIQESQEDWLFLRKEFEFSVTSAASEYPPYASSGSHANLSDWKKWYRDSLRLYLTASGVADEQFLMFHDYESFRDLYRFGARLSQRPMVFSLRPRDHAIMFDYTPDATYTCVGDYYRQAVVLAADGDTPEVDSQYHMLIVGHATVAFGIDRSAPEMIAKGQKIINDLSPGFERKYLPEVVL